MGFFSKFNVLSNRHHESYFTNPKKGILSL